MKTKSEGLRRLTLAELSRIVDELLDKALDELWTAITEDLPPDLYRMAAHEARGYWWGAFIIALDMGGFRISGDARPDEWRWGMWRKWVEEAALAARFNRQCVAAAVLGIPVQS